MNVQHTIDAVIATFKPRHSVEIQLDDDDTQEQISDLITRLNAIDYITIHNSNGNLRIINCTQATPIQKTLARVDSAGFDWLHDKIMVGGISKELSGRYGQFRRIIHAARKDAKQQGKEELATLCKQIVQAQNWQLEKIFTALLDNNYKGVK